WEKLRLSPSRSHKIQFQYGGDKRSLAQVNSYEPPDCNMLSMDRINNTKPFTPAKGTLDYLNYWGKKYSYSPSLVAGLIAQESAFNPRAVSWAKAVGLTQVTPLADQEVAKRYRRWPRSKKIRRLPASLLKSWIHLGKVSPKEDWRLDPERSIQGGYEYLHYLHGYWHKKQNLKVFSSIYGESPKKLTEIILASYNSGAYRVKSALKSYGPEYLLSSDLNEAKKYVSKVFSYCYHFAQDFKARGDL
ncbi:transglycosylase SLT domain-containing protein, partial [Bdellovibrionales bacterium]|nr:transglycosylase SLT domain-containing protein [Bdellovibrionales bacterium]